MPTPDGRMTSTEFREALAILDLTPRSFTALVVALGDPGLKERTAQRWSAGTQDIPGPITALLQLLVLMLDMAGVTPAVVLDWVDAAAVEPKENVRSG